MMIVTDDFCTGNWPSKAETCVDVMINRPWQEINSVIEVIDEASHQLLLQSTIAHFISRDVAVEPGRMIEGVRTSTRSGR